MALEIIWSRLGALLIGGSVYAFAVVLSFSWESQLEQTFQKMSKKHYLWHYVLLVF